MIFIAFEELLYNGLVLLAEQFNQCNACTPQLLCQRRLLGLELLKISHLHSTAILPFLPSQSLEVNCICYSDKWAIATLEPWDLAHCRIDTQARADFSHRATKSGSITVELVHI